MSKLFNVSKNVGTVKYKDCDLKAFDLIDEYLSNRDLLTFPSNSVYIYMINRSFGYFVENGFLVLLKLNQKGDIELVDIPFDKEGNPMEISDVVNLMKRCNSKKILYIADKTVELLGLKKGKFSFDDDEIKVSVSSLVGTEYVYDLEGLSSLSGGRFAKLRSKVNRFKNNNEYKVVDYDGSQKMKKEMMSIYEKWKAVEGDKYFRIIDANPYRYALDYCDDLHYNSFIVYLLSDGVYKPVSMAGYFDLTEELGYMFAVKADTTHVGLSDFTRWTLSCKAYERGHKLLHDGCDGKQKGLKEFKEKFSPVITYTNYVIELI